MNWNARQLHAFLAICRLRSFARAAEQVAITPSGMSMLVADLEAQLGARLFERTTRAVGLTDAARRLQPVAARVLRELQEAEDGIAGDERQRATRLAVAATPMVSANLLPRVVHAFARSHPAVRVLLSDVDVDGVRERVIGGEAEIGLGFFFRPAARMRRRPLCRFPLMAVAPATRAGAGRAPDRPWSSLAGVPLVALPAHNPIQSLIERHLPVAHEPPPRLTVNLIGTVVAMVEAGMGHAVVPAFALPDCLRHRVAVARLVGPPVAIDLVLASRTGAKLSPVATAFAAALTDAAAAMET
jgi:LysR family carnitine catabolism transcriptional activator